MKRTEFIILSVSMVFGLLCFARPAQAIITYFNGDLTISGLYKEQMYIRTHIPRIEKDFHKSNIDFWRSSLFVEGLYKIKDEGDFVLNFFAGFRYFYEKAPALDSEFKNAIPHRPYSEYLHPYQEDYITEMYVDIQKGPWQFKIGKQIVVWGETNIKQTADIINPIDTRHGSPGTENWEEIKLGLWMIRGTYQSNLPGYLNFEALFIPGDFKMARVPIEGTHYGPSPATTSFNPGKMPGIYNWVMDKARDDEPGWKLSNYEYAIKVRGFTKNVDWSIFYFNTISDEMIADKNRVTPYTLEYVKAGIGSIITDQTIRPHRPRYRVFKFPRYEVLGATFQTALPRGWFKEWRLELFFAFGQPFNKGTDGESSGVYDEVRRNNFGFGLECRDYFEIPYFTRRWFDNKKMSISLTIFYDKIMNHDRDLVVRSGRGHRTGDSHAFEITWSISQYLDKSKFFTMFTGSYNPIGKYFLCPVLGYAPGDHWRFESGVAIYGSKASSNKGLHDKDFVLLRVRYEF